jgi:hypothetical protein
LSGLRHNLYLGIVCGAFLGIADWPGVADFSSATPNVPDESSSAVSPTRCVLTLVGSPIAITLNCVSSASHSIHLAARCTVTLESRRL